MAQNKEQLKKLLAFIDSLAKDKGNAWFVEELKKRYVPSSISSNLSIKNGMIEKIDKIEHYLALDYSYDDISTEIDYSYISNPSVRTHLESDYREMLRYRDGVRSHKADFDEYCRYAHLQAESLLNYYFGTSYTFYDAASTIGNHCHKMLGDKFDSTKFKTCSSIEQIEYGYKLMTFIQIFYSPNLGTKSWFSKDGQYLYDILWNVKETRNAQSHRGIMSKMDYLDYQNQLKKMALPWKNDDFDMDEINRNQYLKSTYYKEVSKNPDYKRYKLHMWIISCPYTNVYDALNCINGNIKHNKNK